MRIMIDEKRCKLCGICIRACPQDNLIQQGKSVVSKDECSGCMLCEKHCPDFAISVEGKEESQ